MKFSSKRCIMLGVMLVAICTQTYAQLRLDFGRESALRKLYMAEAAISNLYVDSVDEGALAEDAIRGISQSSTRTLPILRPRRLSRSMRVSMVRSTASESSSTSSATRCWSSRPSLTVLQRKSVSCRAIVSSLSMTRLSPV